jgi:hypothetical protein
MAGADTTTCALAGTLALPVSLVSGKLDGPSQSSATSCSVAETRGPQAVYLLEVPEQTGLSLIVTAMGRFVVSIRRACDDPATEVACQNGEPASSIASLRTVLEPGTYWVVVDLVDESTSGGDYTLSLASNGACERAADIVENAAGVGNAATVFGDLAGGEPSPLPLSCSNSGELGNTLHYRARLPAGDTLTARARRSDVGEPLPVNVVDSCTSTQCLADGIGQARHSNVGTMAIDVIIKVGSGDQSGPLPFELQVAQLPLAANAICTSPKAISAGAPIDGDTSSGSTTPLPCMDRSVGALYYSIVVPAGMSLSAEVTPTDTFDARLVILDTCGSESCLAGSPAPSGEVKAEFANVSPSPRPIIVAVSAAASVGRFTLNTTLH